jgi:hypothetical protein
MGIRAALVAATTRPEVIDPRSAGEPPGVFSKVLSRILPELPHYRRQYAGIVVGGRKQILCRFFLPNDVQFRAWQCNFVAGNDFGAELWLIRFDLESGTYEGFDVGS